MVFKVDEVMASRTAQKLFKAAEKTLDVVDKMRDGNAVAKVAASMKAVEIATDIIRLTDQHPIDNYLKQNKILSQKDCMLKSIMMSSSINSEVVIVDEGIAEALVRHEVSPDNFIYEKNKIHGERHSNEDDVFYADKNFSVKDFYAHLYARFGQFMALSIGSTISRANGWEKDTINVIPSPPPPTSIMDNALHLRTLSLDFDEGNRSCMLFGPPGTGKTTHVYRLAEEKKANVLKVDVASLASDRAKSSILEIVASIKPGIVLLDDLDRVPKSASLLALLEELKHLQLDSFFVATCNDIRKLPDALRRPGRFDRFIKIDIPDDEEFDLLIDFFKSKVDKNVDLSGVDLNKLKGFSHAYVKEFWERVKMEGSTINIDEVIAEFKERL